MPQKEEPPVLKRLEENRRELPSSVEAVDQLTPEQHDGKKRAAKFLAQKHFAEKVLPCLNWLYFVVISIFVFVVVFLAASYVWDIHSDTEAIKALIVDIFQVFLISGATLFVESKFDKN